MSNLKTFEAFALQKYETGESSIIVHSLSPELGRISLMVKGGKTRKDSPVHRLESLNHVQVVANLREGSDIATVREVSILWEPDRLRQKIGNLSAAMLLAETAADATESGQPSPEVFEALQRSLITLNEASPEEFNLTMVAAGMMEILRVSGQFPTFAKEILQPWPSRTPKPRVFQLQFEEATFSLPEYQFMKEPKWPTALDLERIGILLPGTAIRFAYNYIGMNPLTELEAGEAIQLITALSLQASWRHGRVAKSLQFFREIN